LELEDLNHIGPESRKGSYIDEKSKKVFEWNFSSFPEEQIFSIPVLKFNKTLDGQSMDTENIILSSDFGKAESSRKDSLLKDKIKTDNNPVA
jgi:hypothetical protein